MTVKITSLQAENVKRVKAVAMTPAENGLTVIGGRNGQGKTSVLDAIAWALGGERMKPSDAKRDGSATDPVLKVTLSNGIIVERKGKNGTLKVSDPEGRKAGQMLLDTFVESLALDLPKFLAKSDKEKADVLLQIIGVGDQLKVIEQQYTTLYNQRTGVGQMRDQKKSVAADMPLHANTPVEPISATELIKSQQQILAKNGENQRLRDQVPQLEARRSELAAQVQRLTEQIDELRDRRSALVIEQINTESDLETAKKTAEQLQDESTVDIQIRLQQIDNVNANVRDNQRRAEAMQEADELDEQYKEITGRIDDLRNAKAELLKGADLPLPELLVEDGQLVYNGRKWDCMSGSEQLRVATAIIRKLKPECGFVLVDKLEQMDAQTLAEFGVWAEAEGLQVIATRVSTGDECSIVIEDGYAEQTGAPVMSNPEIETAPTTITAPSALPISTPTAAPAWQAGRF